MVTFNLGDCVFETKDDIANTLTEIANSIYRGYTSGITCGGVCWYIEGDEEFEDDEED